MTVRLLKPYAQRPVGAIATFDASTEAGMIEAKQASADLTGGFEYFLPRPGLKLQVSQIAVGSLTLGPAEQAPAVLPEGQALNVSGIAGTVGKVHRLNPTGGNAPLQTWTIGAGALAQIGPYAGLQHFLVTCSTGSVEATVGNAALQASPKTAKSLPVIVWQGDSTTAYSNAQSGNASSLIYNGNGTATIAFSGDQGIRVGDLMTVQGAADAAYNTSRPTACVAQVGNAYTYAINNPTMPVTTPDTGTSILLCYPLKASAAGAIGLTHNMTGRKLRHINAGRNGDTVPQMLARFWTDVASWNPDRVVFCAGINDAYAAGYSLSQMKANITTLLQYCQQIGAKLDIVTPFPQVNTRGSWSSAKNLVFLQWCRWLPQFAAANSLICESWGAAAAGTVQVQDPASATGNPTATMYNADLVHPKNSATYCLAKRMAAAYNTIYPTGGSTSGRMVTDGGLLSNPTMLGSGGTPSAGTGTIAAGPIANGLGLAITAGSPTITPYQTARTVAADGDLGGNWQGFSMAATASGDQFTVAFPPMHTLVSNGDVVDFKVQARLAVGGNLVKEFYFFCNSQTAISGNNLVTDMQLATGQMAPYPENFSVLMGADIPVRGPLSVHGAPRAFQPTIRITANVAGTMALEIACASADKYGV